MFSDFKPILKILLRFLIIYLVLLGGYQLYLNHYSGSGLDPFSVWVADQSTAVQNLLGYPSQMVPLPEYDRSYFYVSDDYRSYMVEGCNSISVMILFVAFVFSFYKGLKTFVFVILGLVFMHLVNVLRIAGLNILLVEMPEYSKIGHDYLFPAIIYGSVVLLWLIWIKCFALKINPNENT
ncbi:MAG: exosortase family protein XrtF [Cruoricaptor ignavus]|nr:exosortase family protein XrtF [Cruoricaptor ignavus]